jgi:hypothetical protein
MPLPGLSTRDIILGRGIIRTPRTGATSGGGVPPPPMGTTGVGGPTPFAQTREGIVFGAEQQRELLGIQSESAEALARQQHLGALEIQAGEQAFQTQQLERRLASEAAILREEREHQRLANINQLRVDRQATFSQMMKEGDQVRAVIFALGYGPENDAFDVRAQALGTSVQELKGAQALRTTTEQALNRILGRAPTTGRGGGRRDMLERARRLKAGKGRVTIGEEGVRGLGPAILCPGRGRHSNPTHLCLRCGIT